MNLEKMLRGKLSSVIRRQGVKYLSTNTSPQVFSVIPEELIRVNPKEEEVLRYPDYFKVHNLFTIKDLFDAKVHYGHKEISVTRNMKPFIFGTRLGHIIFDLDITAYHLREALNFTAHIAYRGGIILFISRNPRMTLLVENTAKECKEFAAAREWRMGTFSDLESRSHFSRLPDLCILLNTLEENGFQHQSVIEAAKFCIPTIGIVDSNCHPNLITYPVPGNDDSYSCFQLYCKLFKEAILRGKREREKHLKENLKVQETDSTDNTNTVDSNKKIYISDLLNDFKVEK